MALRNIITIIILQIFSAEAFLYQYPEFELGPRDGGDPGDPLFLTPFIEAGNFTEGQRLSRVPLTDTFYITSYSGFFTVHKTYNSNQFFWYFPAMKPNNTNAPVIVWLQGGPGESSLMGLFFEHGPLKIRNKVFERRDYTWALNHHIIYIDNPVGAGFSFTANSTGYCKDEVQVGEELYATMIQFFQLFPELQSNKFYITGESYGGKYAPALAYTIHKKNPTAQMKINLKGIAIGNGFSDPEHQYSFDKYLYQLGLVDWNQAKAIKYNETLVTNYIKHQKWESASFEDAVLYNTLLKMTGFKNLNNYITTKSGIDDEAQSELYSLIDQNTNVRKAIHVGGLLYNGLMSYNTYRYLMQDMMQSVAPWVSELLDHYKVLTYNGQLDIIVAYPLTVNYLRKLNFTGVDEYKTAKRHIWVLDNEVAGYVKRAGNLTEKCRTFSAKRSAQMGPGYDHQVYS